MDERTVEHTLKLFEAGARVSTNITVRADGLREDINVSPEGMQQIVNIARAGLTAEKERSKSMADKLHEALTGPKVEGRKKHGDMAEADPDYPFGRKIGIQQRILDRAKSYGEANSVTFIGGHTFKNEAYRPGIKVYPDKLQFTPYMSSPARWVAETEFGGYRIQERPYLYLMQLSGSPRSLCDIWGLQDPCLLSEGGTYEQCEAMAQADYDNRRGLQNGKAATDNTTKGS